MNEYDMGNELLKLEDSLYGGCPDETYLCVDGNKYTTINDLRKAYYCQNIDAQLFLTMSTQFIKGVITGSIQLDNFYNNCRIIFNNIKIKKAQIQYLKIIGYNIHVTVQNSMINYGKIIID